MRDIPTAAFPWMLERMRGGEPLSISCAADLPPEAAAERRLLANGHTQSAILMPLRHAGALSGLIGADAMRARGGGPLKTAVSCG